MPAIRRGELFWPIERPVQSLFVEMKMVRIFSDRIRDRIHLEGLRSVRIRVRMFNIRYRIRIRILKSYIYDVDIQSYLIRHC